MSELNAQKDTKMAIFGKDSEEKWEKKLEKSFSDFKNESRESEASLREAIQNVSFAAEGVNSEIDFQLKRINVQLDSRAESSHLCNTSRSILDKKKLYNKQNSEGLKSTITKLIEFSRGLPKAKEIAKEIKAIEKEIKTAEDSDVHKILHNLIQILKSGLAQQSELVDEEESSSWFSNRD